MKILNDRRVVLKTEPISTYVIYHGVEDFPDHYVVRRWEICDGDLRHCELMGQPAASLALARKQVPKGLMRMDRHPDDVPGIVETWI